MEYLKLMRVKHYVKNVLVFIPLFFNRTFFNLDDLAQIIMGFICFSMISSAVYILNDIRDVEKDKNHPKKKMRPIASGRVSKRKAIILLIVCILVATIISGLFLKKSSIIFLALYFVLNVIYSMGLKNYPIIDVVILASGFVIRVLYGGALVGIEISKWLYLVIVTGALYMGLGKRRNELKQQKNTREVLKYYNEAFLDKNMYVAVSLVIVFYALWTMESASSVMTWTVPFFVIILMRYSFDIEGTSDGDPVEVLMQDKILIILSVLYAICIFVLLYLI